MADWAACLCNLGLKRTFKTPLYDFSAGLPVIIRASSVIFISLSYNRIKFLSELSKEFIKQTNR